MHPTSGCVPHGCSCGECSPRMAVCPISAVPHSWLTPQQALANSSISQPDVLESASASLGSVGSPACLLPLIDAYGSNSLPFQGRNIQRGPLWRGLISPMRPFSCRSGSHSFLRPDLSGSHCNPGPLRMESQDSSQMSSCPKDVPRNIRNVSYLCSIH